MKDTRKEVKKSSKKEKQTDAPRDLSGENEAILEILTNIYRKWQGAIEREEGGISKTETFSPLDSKHEPSSEAMGKPEEFLQETMIIRPSRTDESASGPHVSVQSKDKDMEREKILSGAEIPDTVILSPRDTDRDASRSLPVMDSRNESPEETITSSQDRLPETAIISPNKTGGEQAANRDAEPDEQDFSTETVILKPNKTKGT